MYLLDYTLPRSMTIKTHNDNFYIRIVLPFIVAVIYFYLITVLFLNCKTRSETINHNNEAINIPYTGNVWGIAILKVICKTKFGEWIDFGHKDTIYKLKFGRLNDSSNLPNISAITSCIHINVYSKLHTVA